MLKTETINITKTVHYTYCDKCDAHIGRDSTQTRCICEICECDLCKGCVGDTQWAGDHVIAHCKSCWDIRQVYAVKVGKLELEIDKLWTECETECFNKLK